MAIIQVITIYHAINELVNKNKWEKVGKSVAKWEILLYICNI
jgi:hypothetical protein